MTVLAIDPGPTQSAYVLWNGISVLGVGIVPNNELIDQVLVSGPRPSLLAIEMIASYGMAVGASVFDTCVWIGRFLEAWHHDPTAIRILRLDVKVHLCKSAKAKDANIRQALIDRLGIVGTKKAPGRLFGVSSHAWAALAVAVTAHDRAMLGGGRLCSQ